MVSPHSFVRRCRFATAVLVGAWVLTVAGRAEELPAKIFLQGNPTPQEGSIVNVQGDTIALTVPNGRMSVSLSQVVRVQVAAPAAYSPGMTAFQAGNFDKALADLAPIAETFRGLPTDWAQQTLATVGNLYLEKNDLARAETAFNDFRRLYPNAPGSKVSLSVAQARLAFAKNNVAQARAQLDPILTAALKAPAEVTRGDGAAYGQACLLMARLQEKDGNFQGALENYLRVVTLFYQDVATANRAQKSADDLRTAHKDLRAP